MNLPGKGSQMMSKWISSFLHEWMFANIVLLFCFKLVITVAALHKENPSSLYRTHIYCLQGSGWIFFPPPPTDRAKCSVDFEGCFPLKFSHCWRHDTKHDGPIVWFNMAIPLLLVFFKLASVCTCPSGWFIAYSEICSCIETGRIKHTGCDCLCMCICV